MKISAEVKERLEKVLDAAQTIFHWGFVPFILYLGLSKGSDPGMPPLTIRSLLWQ